MLDCGLGQTGALGDKNSIAVGPSCGQDMLKLRQAMCACVDSLYTSERLLCNLHDEELQYRDECDRERIVKEMSSEQN